MCRVFFLLLVLINVFSSCYCNTITTTTFNDMESNVVFADALADAVKPASFPSFITGAATTGFKFITSIISFVDTVLKFTGTNESQELLEIKRLYNEMSQRFDSIDLQLKGLQIQMKWSEFANQFGPIEQNINTNYVRFQNIFLRPLNLKESEKKQFIAAFKMTCMNCAMDLYRGFLGEDPILIGDILRKAEPLLKYNRSKMQTLMTGLFQLLVKGISTELLYDKLVHGDTYYTTCKNEWFGKIQNVTSRMTFVDLEVKNKWHDQASTDIDDLSVQYVSQSNQIFSTTLYNFLTGKYYWRDWLVIVYKPIWLAKNHNNFVCGGYRKYRLHGRNIVVASVNGTKPAINTTGLLQRIQNTKTIHWSTYKCSRGHYCTTENRLDAADVYADLPKHCSIYASVGVIDSWVNLWYQGLPERLVHMRTPGRNSYSVHYFG